MTIFEALTWANDTLKAVLSPVQNPKLDAQALLASVVGKGTAYLFAHGDDPLLPPKDDIFRALVARRAKHEPIAYILEKKAFYGREFVVSPAVLIPRPDTEVLVDAAKALVTERTLIVDVGTGSGAIAVTLARETGRHVVAIDDRSDALAVARENAALHECAQRMLFLEGNLLTPLLTESNGESLGDHVLLTANLPYLTALQYAALDPDIRDYEPEHALVSGVDGLDHYDALFTQLALRRHAFPTQLDVVIEIDPGQHRSAPASIAHHFPHARTTVLPDHTHRPRVVVAQI